VPELEVFKRAAVAGVLAATLLVPIAGASTKVPAAKSDTKPDRQRELADLRARMEKLGREVESAESQKSEAADALKASESQFARAGG
jgi:hypothetical protein